MPQTASKPARKPLARLMRTLKKKNNRRRLIAASVVTGNVIILAVVISVVLSSSQNGSADAPLTAVATNGNAAVANPLDHVSSANIAQTVARMSNLPETTAVTNQADSQTTELSLAPATAAVVEKPQMVSASAFASNKDIKTYTTVSGDTITSIAAKFGVTSDSIRWSNNLTGDAVNAGLNLLIPPVTGIIHTVQAGDTPATLAAKFRADQNKIIASNDAELSGLKVGERILIPDGSKIVVPAVVTRTSSWSGSASYGGYNGYDFGYCTYWVAKLRAQNGNAVPTNLGNAATWAVRAAAMGLPTGTTPRVGAAVVTSTRGAGHVAYVTGVNDDGTITISEMNHAGWNKVNSRTLTDTGFRYVY